MLRLVNNQQKQLWWIHGDSMTPPRGRGAQTNVHNLQKLWFMNVYNNHSYTFLFKHSYIYYIYSNVCPFSNPLMSILNGGISWKTNRQLPTAFRRLGWMILMPQIMPIMGIWGMKKKPFMPSISAINGKVVDLPLWKIWKSMGRIIPYIMENILCNMSIPSGYLT